jgi:hypothetical protein
VRSVYFSDVLQVLLRRWVLVVLGLAITIAGCVAAIGLVATNYQATGLVLLLPPSEPAPVSSRINPYLNLPSGLTFTAGLIAGTVTSRDTQREMNAAGFRPAYSVSVQPGTGPLLVVSVEDTDQVAALTTRDELIRRIESELARIQVQEATPENQSIVARQFSVSAQAEALAGAKLRALAIILALGTILTAVVVFGVERVSAKRARATPSTDTTEPINEPEPTPGEAKNSGPPGQDRMDVERAPVKRAPVKRAPVKRAPGKRARATHKTDTTEPINEPEPTPGATGNSGPPGQDRRPGQTSHAG